MLKLWGRLSSDVPFERIDAGATFGMTKTPEYHPAFRAEAGAQILWVEAAVRIRATAP
jgi:hypothetical protein